MDQKKTGEFIKQKRMEKGITQQELAERLGVSNKTVSRWETGVYMPDISLLAPLAEILGVEVSDILSAETARSAGSRTTIDFSEEKCDNHRKCRPAVILLMIMVLSGFCFADIAYGYFSTSLNWNITNGFFEPKGLIFKYVFGLVGGSNNAGTMLTQMFTIFIIFLVLTIALILLTITVSVLEKRRYQRSGR